MPYKLLYKNKERHPKLDAPLLKENGNNILSHNLMQQHRHKLTRGANFERRNEKEEMRKKKARNVIPIHCQLIAKEKILYINKEEP